MMSISCTHWERNPPTQVSIHLSQWESFGDGGGYWCRHLLPLVGDPEGTVPYPKGLQIRPSPEDVHR